MKRLIWVAIFMAVALIAGCGEDVATSPESSLDELTAEEAAKIAPDLEDALLADGLVDIIVQADPQTIFEKEISPAAQQRLLDPAVIWKASLDGAVIWKFTPEQAVIWKMSFDRAVIWKLVDKLNASGYAIDEVFDSIHAFKLTADRAVVRDLVKLDEVSYITPDRDVQVSSLSLTNSTLGMDMVQVRTNATNFNGLTGEGVAVAVVDSGIDATQGDFGGASGSRIVAVKNFSTEGTITNVADNYGHGTHVAGLIAGNGRDSYIKGYNTTFEGVAPEAKLVVAKVLKSDGSGSVSSVISALQWILSIRSTYNIRVANLSLGLPPMDPWSLDPLCQAVENAVANGLLVVVAAGNYGYYNGKTLYGVVASPGITPSAVTVGASDSRDTVLRQQDPNGHNDNVAFFSSRGPTAWNGLAKPDLLAPGVEVIAPLADGSTLAASYPNRIVDACTYGGTPCGRANADYFKMSGTSMAAPLVAGTAALLLQANPSLTVNATKAILMLTAEPLFYETSPASCYTNENWRNDANCRAIPAIEQGSGLLNVPGASFLALSVRQDTNLLHAGDTWLLDESVEPITVFSSTGDEVIWSQGLAWTGITVSGENLYNLFQGSYQPGVVWGTGLAWTGIVIGTDPVFTPIIRSLWASSFVSPQSLDGNNRVLGGYTYDWEATPDYSNQSDEWFPQG
ncbi:MAG: S8 family peptidase [Myxococcales bacterium]|nr:S8 family peptidase [Myxococcales bacterium]